MVIENQIRVRIIRFEIMGVASALFGEGLAGNYGRFV